jgi:hypothetical protein
LGSIGVPLVVGTLVPLAEVAGVFDSSAPTRLDYPPAALRNDGRWSCSWIVHCLTIVPAGGQSSPRRAIAQTVPRSDCVGMSTILLTGASGIPMFKVDRGARSCSRPERDVFISQDGV